MAQRNPVRLSIRRILPVFLFFIAVVILAPTLTSGQPSGVVIAARFVSLLLFPLLVSLAGSVVQAYGRPVSGKTIKFALSGILYGILAGSYLAGITSATGGFSPVFPDLIALIIGLFSVSLLGRSLALSSDSPGYYATLQSASWAGVVMVASVVFWTFPATWYLFYPVLYVGIVTFLGSPKVSMLESKDEGTVLIGKYMVLSIYRWYTFAFFLGIMTSLIFLPSLQGSRGYLIIFLFLLLLLAFMRVLIRTYNYQTERIQGISLAVYSKHRHKVEISHEPLVDSLDSTITDFTVNGAKEKLIVLLSMLLTDTGSGYDEIERLLDPIISYRSSEILFFPPLRTVQRISKEVEVRERLLDVVIKNINARLGVAKV